MYVDNPIIDFVERRGGSSRLVSALGRGLARGALPFTTLDELHLHRRIAPSSLLRVHGVGMATANEFRDLIEKNLDAELIATGRMDFSQRLVKQDSREAANPSTVTEDAIDGDERIDLFVARVGGSVRLANALGQGLKEGRLPFQTVSQFLKGGSAFERALYRVEGIGLKSAREFVELTRKERGVGAYSDASGQANALRVESEAGESVSGLGPTLLPEGRAAIRTKELQDFENFGRTQPARFESGLVTFQDSLEGLSLRAALLDSERGVLRMLKEPERNALDLRYGLNGGSPRTLDEVGKKLGVTRERVRQLESKALNKLSLRWRNDLNGLLSRDGGQIWSALTKGTGILRESDRRAAEKQLDAAQRLTIDVVFGDLRKWLSEVARPDKGGWIAPDLFSNSIVDSSERVLELLEQSAAIKRRASPLEFVASEIGVTAEVLRAAVTLSDKWVVFGGYVVRRPVGKRVRRAIRAHMLFADQPLRMPIRGLELRLRYQRRYSDDQCSSRDLQISMREFPGLFLNMYEEGWFALSAVGTEGGDLKEEALITSTDNGTKAEGVASDETGVGVLRSILESKGLVTFDDLRETFVAQTNGRYSKSSVGPMLLSSDDFVRVAPGVYGLRGLLERQLRADRARGLLLTEKQLEMYCQARWAGEPSALFLLWSPAMEYAWAKWAERNASREHFSSLLFVAEPRMWPTNTSEVLRWSALKARIGDYQLEEFNPIALEEALPTFQDLVRAAAFARARGFVSWMSINRVRGARFDDRHAHAILALLIGLGIVEPATHWQRKHNFEIDSSDYVDALAGEISSDAATGWSAGAARLVAARLEHQKSEVRGWVPDGELEAMIQRLDEAAYRDAGSRPQLENLPQRSGSSALEYVLKVAISSRAKQLISTVTQEN